MAEVFRVLCAVSVRSFGTSSLSTEQKQVRKVLAEHLDTQRSIVSLVWFSSTLIFPTSQFPNTPLQCSAGRYMRDADKMPLKDGPNGWTKLGLERGQELKKNIDKHIY